MAKEIQDIVVLKNLSRINGEVLVKKFILKLDVGTLELKKEDILSIEYKNPPHTKTDDVKVRGGTHLHGDLSPSVIPVRFGSTNQVLNIPKTDIHTIILFIGRGRVSAATRKLLKSVA
jgi:hypothetical protein